MSTSLNLKNKKIVVTGGRGFLGKHVVRKLEEGGIPAKNIKVISSKDFDLREQAAAAAAVKGANVIIHLAANVGGIGYNKAYPATLFYDNLLMGIHLMEASRAAKVEKFVALGTVCAYPKFTPVPFKESDLWVGYPEETNAPYGLAKKMLLVQAQAYREQYGFNAIFLLPVNLYGPGDNFDDQSSHVIPALIKKFVKARENREPEVVVWGTGKASREFLYVRDAAEGIILATEKYNKNAPVNVGASFEITIRELAQLIKKLTNYKGKVVFDKTKPDGQPRRKLDTTRAFEEFGFKSTTPFKEGLQETIEWFEKKYSL